jgi:hypothetical protein
VGRIAPDGTGVTEFPIGGSMVNGQLAAGPDGNVWFSDHGESTVNRIGKITTDGVVTVYMLPSPGIALPQYDLFLTSGLDGNLWFTQANSVGKITPDGTITQFAVPTANARPSGIVFAGDGNIWFNEQNGGKVGQLVLSSINGSQATINENVLPANGYTGLFLLQAPQPPAAKTGEAPLARKSCSDSMQLVARSSGQPDLFLLLTVAFTTCADLNINDGLTCVAGSTLRGEDRVGALLCNVTVTNDGPDTAIGVVLHFFFDVKVPTNSGGGNDIYGGNDFEIGSLAPGSSATRQQVVDLHESKRYVQVTVRTYSETFDPNGGNNEDEEVIQLSLSGVPVLPSNTSPPAPPKTERGHTP